MITWDFPTPPGPLRNTWYGWYRPCSFLSLNRPLGWHIVLDEAKEGGARKTHAFCNDTGLQINFCAEDKSGDDEEERKC